MSADGRERRVSEQVAEESCMASGRDTILEDDSRPLAGAVQDRRETTRNPEEIIHQMVRRIVDLFQPQRVILFGSWARGEQNADSDVDFLVIVKEARDRRSLRIAIRHALTGFGLPKDIVVLTPEEFEIKSKIPGTIAYPAAREGKLLYAV
jgi:uncharacterized protein